MDALQLVLADNAQVVYLNVKLILAQADVIRMFHVLSRNCALEETLVVDVPLVQVLQLTLVRAVDHTVLVNAAELMVVRCGHHHISAKIVLT